MPDRYRPLNAGEVVERTKFICPKCGSALVATSTKDIRQFPIFMACPTSMSHTGLCSIQDDCKGVFCYE